MFQAGFSDLRNFDFGNSHCRVFPQVFTAESPTDCNIKYSFQGPSFGHIFGYNVLGCDLFARTVYGAQATLLVAFVATLGVVIIGGTLGVCAGFFGGWLDGIVTWLTSVFAVFPVVLGVFLITYLPVFGGEKTLFTMSLSLLAFSWPVMARTSRAAVIKIKDSDFITAVRALGASRSTIIFRHILPNSLTPIITTGIFSLGDSSRWKQRSLTLAISPRIQIIGCNSTWACQRQ